MNNINRWVWLDLEMTGLNEKECVILEAAMIITDTKLNELSSINLVIWQPEHILQQITPLIQVMHTNNGLLKKVRNSNISITQAETKLMNIITNNVPFKGGILAGNSIYTDRRFLNKYMPLIDNYLHYQHLDVSSIKILTETLLGQQGKAPKNNSNHQAMSDIKQSIKEFKFYQKYCFKNKI